MPPEIATTRGENNANVILLAYSGPTCTQGKLSDSVGGTTIDAMILEHGESVSDAQKTGEAAMEATGSSVIWRKSMRSQVYFCSSWMGIASTSVT